MKVYLVINIKNYPMNFIIDNNWDISKFLNTNLNAQMGLPFH